MESTEKGFGGDWEHNSDYFRIIRKIFSYRMFYKVLFVDTGNLVGETKQHRPKGAATSGGPQKPARTGETVMALTWHGSYL